MLKLVRLIPLYFCIHPVPMIWLNDIHPLLDSGYHCLALSFLQFCTSSKWQDLSELKKAAIILISAVQRKTFPAEADSTTQWTTACQSACDAFFQFFFSLSCCTLVSSILLVQIPDKTSDNFHPFLALTSTVRFIRLNYEATQQRLGCPRLSVNFGFNCNRTFVTHFTHLRISTI